MARTLIAVLTALALLSACGENPTDSGKLDPPSPPSHLRADKFSDGEVVLVWSASEDEDVTGYNIYRSEEDEHHFAKAGFVQGTRFSDVDLDYEKPYFYRVVAINGSGVESASLFISGRPLNNLWPAMPEDIHAEARNLSSLGYQAVIELRWEPNDEADLAGYRVYGSEFREFPEDATALLAQVDQPWFLHEEIDVGSTYYYKVTAVDRGDLESLPAQSAVELLPPLALEQPINGLYTNDKPLFVWQPVAALRPQTRVRYTISLAAGPIAREIWVSEVEGNDTRLRYSGKKLATGTYWWKVLVEVLDEQDNALSMSLSTLAHFRIR